MTPKPNLFHSSSEPRPVDTDTSRRLANALGSLPDHLIERTRTISIARASCLFESAVSPLVYWTHHALRTDENPALDTACELAKLLGRPLLVYQGLSSDYRYASSRHHVFQIQAARDLQEDYDNLGIRYAFNLQTRNDQSRALLRVAQDTDLLITDDFPGEPTDRWLKRLSHLEHLTILAVDTACVVPMRLVGRSYDRAFAYRDATTKLYKERIDRPWGKPASTPERYQGSLPFAPLDFQELDPLKIVSQCDIDPMVSPVGDTIGGSRAGYQRWEEFLSTRIGRYAAKRNDPCSDVSSRMSAYLHYGMVSPMRLARQASQRHAEKYLDELLIWRELAYGYCFYRNDYRSVSTLPTWAIESLRKHQRDQRDRLYSWETLARGQTEDSLWNACQQSLLKHGELHNNVRMTWGKSLLQWTDSPEQALQLLIDLNHRYALDGRDPASYGGILWCLGQFDRPFTPEQSVLGSVRGRSTSEHLGRLDLKKYQTMVNRPVAGNPCKVAVIGAGIAGSICSRTLSDIGFEVEVFEKSRGAGGRAATRRLASGDSIDHGAPFFESPSRNWDLRIESWEQDKIVSEWSPKLGRWDHESADGSIAEYSTGNNRLWVGHGGMSQLGKYLAKELHVRYRTVIQSMERREQGWYLSGMQSLEDGSDSALEVGPYDCVVVAVPAPQAAGLVDPQCKWKSIAAKQQMAPTWALLLEFEQTWQIPWDAISFTGHPILEWISRQTSKSNRNARIDSSRLTDAWSIHANAQWSQDNIEGRPEDIAGQLFQALEGLGLGNLPKPVSLQAHRWRYAQAVGLPHSSKERETESPMHHSHYFQPPYLWDQDQQCGGCGDWVPPGSPSGFLGRPSGIARALESGAGLADCVIRHWMARFPASNKGFEQKQAFQPMLFSDESI